MRAISRIALCLWLAATLASLSPRSAETVELRHGNRFGAAVGVLADPVPSVVSAEVSYDLAPSWRLHGGLGAGASPGFLEDRTWQTYGAGVRFLVLPQRPFSPVCGASLTHATVKWDFMLGLGTETQDTWTGGLSAGLDWQTRVGFNAAIGATVLLKPSDGPFETTWGLLPFLRLGWLF
jgi:hypothetical protein